MGSIRGNPRGKYKKKLVKSDTVTCERCSKEFKRKIILLRHMLSKHLGYRAHGPVCARSYISASGCYRHLRDVHNVHTKPRLRFSEKSKNTFLTSDTPSKKNVLSFVAHKSFPEMAKVISFEEKQKFGKHIVANVDIGKGKIVMKTTAFASIEYVSSIESRCFECGKVKNKNSVQCTHCMDVWFCSAKCSLSTSHHSKCDKIFLQTDCREVRLVTKIITVALEMTEDPQALLDFARRVLFADKKSENCLPQFSRYGVILNLKGRTIDEHLQKARRVVKIIASLKQFKSMHSEDFKRIVFYMASRHLSTIGLNAFTEKFPCKKEYGLYSLCMIFCRDLIMLVSQT